MQQSKKALPLAMLLAAGANSQAVTTSYFSICPTATSTTITLSTTTTLCGPNCHGGTTTIFYDPTPMTTIGPDGRTTIYEELPYTAPCPCDGGICDAVYTITRPCPCSGPPMPLTAIPSGFTAAPVPCHVCAQNGGPSTVTVITPISSGPYASQTPAMGTPYNGASANAGATAYASAGSNGAVASAGAGAMASAGNGNGAAAANANAGAYASSTWNNGSTPGSAGANANANANAGAGNNMVSPVNAPMVNNTGNISPAISPFKGSANRAAYAASAIIAGLAAGLAAFL